LVFTNSGLTKKATVILNFVLSLLGVSLSNPSKDVVNLPGKLEKVSLS